METRANTSSGEISLFSLMEKFTQVRQLSYAMGDHTLYGAPLSLQWSGSVHSYDRTSPERITKREQFEKEAASYDAMVLIEGVPVTGSKKYEYSSYYLRKFYCALMSANPKAKVYLYEGWIHLHASDKNGKYPAPSLFNWRERMVADRKSWNLLSEIALSDKIREPGFFSTVKSYLGMGETFCTPGKPIFIIPVGTAFVTLYDRLKAPQATDHLQLPSGEALTLSHLYQNPYIDWPQNWPLASQNKADTHEKEILSKLRLRDPAQKFDDIHPSPIGIYFLALVHFATLYQQSPVGLPPLEILGEKTSQTLQHIAWEVVSKDPMSGLHQ